MFNLPLSPPNSKSFTVLHWKLCPPPFCALFFFLNSSHNLFCYFSCATSELLEARDCPKVCINCIKTTKSYTEFLEGDQWGSQMHSGGGYDSRIFECSNLKQVETLLSLRKKERLFHSPTCINLSHLPTGTFSLTYFKDEHKLPGKTSGGLSVFPLPSQREDILTRKDRGDVWSFFFFFF